MSVAIVAKFPSRGTRLLAEIEPPSVHLLTDTRVSSKSGGKRTVWDIKAPKQYRLSENLIICYTSSHFFPTIKASDQKAKDPSCWHGAYSTINDIKKMGQIFKDQHDKYGGLSEVLAVIWEKDCEDPKIFELMHPDYKPVLRNGIIGIGQQDVLDRFKELYNQKPFGIVGTKGTGDIMSSLIVASAFKQAIEEADSNSTVGLPIQLTVVTKDKMSARKLGILRNGMTEPEPLTIEDDEVALPMVERVIKRYKGPKRKAFQLIPGLPQKKLKQDATLRIVLRKDKKHSLHFVAILEDYNLYTGQPQIFENYIGNWKEYYENGEIFLNTPRKESNHKLVVPLRKLSGHKKIFACNTDINNINWEYQPKPDSVTQRTLIVDLDETIREYGPFTTELWVVEKDRSDLLESIITGKEHNGMPIIKYIISDWTSPMLVIVLWTLSANAWDTLKSSIESNKANKISS